MKPSSPERDEDLVRRFQEGEESAFAELYERYQRVVFSDCQRRVRDWGAAQDLTNDAFLRIIDRPGSFGERPGKSFAGWLRTVTRNLCLNYLKSHRVARSVALEEHLPVAAAPVVMLDGSFNSEELLRAMNTLPEKQRVCLKMLCLEGKSYAEIAMLTGMAPGHVRSAIQNGKAKLQRVLQKDKDTV